MTTWVQDPAEREVLTDVCECDVKTALARGLAEYVAQWVKVEPNRGLTQTTLRKVITLAAEPEVLSVYPSAAVTFAGQGEYDIGSQQVIAINKYRCLIILSSFSQDMQIELWCTTPEERAVFADAVERAMDPVDWMAGVRLTLEHYYGARATYIVKSVDFDDNDSQNMRRYRIAKFIVGGTVSRLRLMDNTPLDPRAQVTATNPQDGSEDQE